MDMSPGQARVVDPVLTNHATGYRQPGLVADKLFPYVTVPSRAAKRIIFGKQAMRIYDSVRAPGAEYKRVQFGYEAETVSLIQRGLEASVPIEHVEESEAGPKIDLKLRAVGVVSHSIELEREVETATLARTAANYAADNKLAYTDATSWWNAASKPQADVEAAAEVIRSKTGLRPNKLILSASARSAARVHPDVVAYRKSVGQPQVDDDLLRRYFDVEELVVANAVVAGANDAFSDVWGTDAVLAFVDDSEGRQMELPSYGYTYRLRGHPFVTPMTWDGKTDSWVGKYKSEQRPYVVGNDSGFLMQNAGLKA
ncbi:hypothetical protein B5C34_05240 [Pacificimonas flava]|uniref:Major capsid protein E n=2 Tax=Pacificimonas TaxID=1960290 RepID=A0A219B482_9SPHN|nr:MULTISPECIES: hypothetical protein [Pacificimonas]MBZ6377377.1 hypothetical protein [Pacificimonas aurantium]OWV32916.1 hypothetical protein B5C34_05240 [Pacificimonas flava]